MGLFYFCLLAYFCSSLKFNFMKTIEYRGFVIEIQYDQDANDPRKEFDFYTPEEVQAWRDGEVYGWIAKEKGQYIGSCWGYYGDLDYCIQSAKDCVDHQIKQIALCGAIMHF